MSMKRTKTAVKGHLIRAASIWWREAVPDPRGQRGRRWRFSTLMNALWVGVLSATPNLRQLENLTERFWVRISDSTLYGLLVKLPAAPLRRLLVAQVRRAWRAKELVSELGLNVVAIDGKCVWTGHHKANRFCQLQQHQQGRDHYTMRVLRALLVTSRCKVFVGQRPIRSRSAEMSTFGAFFRQLLADYGRTGMVDVLSVDAGMVSKANADLVHGEGRAYIMALKNPQKELVTEAKRVLGRRRKADAQTPWERYRGGRVRRLLFRTTEMAGYHSWSHLQQVWRIRQETERKDGRVIVEQRYFLTSLSSGQTKGQLPLHLVRAHWAIENTGNWTMDTQWKEDDCPWASRALEVVGMLRLLAFNVVARLRARRLRSSCNRARTWRNHILLVTDVLTAHARIASDTLFVQEEPADALT